MKAISNITLMSLLLTFQFLPAQAPDTLWTRTYGGSEDDRGYSVQQTLDGGYIVTGYSGSYPDVILLKTDVNGDTLWASSFGPPRGPNWGYSVKQTSDRGYIITGINEDMFETGLESLTENVFLIKTDSSGNHTWSKTYASPYYGNEGGYSVQQTNDEGYIVTGFGFGLIKTDRNGDTIWTKTVGVNCGYSVQQTSDGGYIVTGKTELFGIPDVYLIRTDSLGNELWTKTFGGVGSDCGNSVQQTNDGGFIIAGYTDSFGEGLTDVWLIKTDANGDTLWTKTFGGYYYDRGNSVQQTLDGGYIITGYTVVLGGGANDVWLIRTDSLGNKLWTKTFGGVGSDCGYSVQQTTDGGYIVTGYTESFGAGSADVWLIKTAPDPMSLKKIETTLVSEYQLSPNYPNPFNPITTIEFALPHSGFVTLKIYNILGEEVITLVSEKLAAGKYKYNWDVTQFGGIASGVYLYRLDTKTGFVGTKKLVLLK